MVCGDRDAEGAEATARDISESGQGSAEWRATDAANDAHIAALAEHTVVTHGRVDIAVATRALNIRNLIL